jgi:hypothetical protein
MSSQGVAGVSGPAGEVLAALEAVLAQAREIAWWQQSDADLATAIAGLHRAETCCAAAGVAALGEAIGRGLPTADGARGGGEWFRGLVPVMPRAAKARADLAEAFGTAAQPNAELAPTGAAFAAGEISVGHAGVLVRTMDAVDEMPDMDQQTRTEAQALMLETATVVDPAQLGRAGLRLRHRLDPQAAARLARDEDRQQELRQACLVQEPSGMWFLRGTLTPVAGAALQAALDPLGQPRPAVDGSPDPRTGGMRTADALEALAQLALAARAGDPGALPIRGGASTRLVLTAELATLLADLTAPGGPAGLVPPVLATGEPGGWEVSPLTLQTLGCDAEVVPVLTDSFGRALDVGDTQYPFPPKIRRAIEVRDQHCTFRNCRAKPAWCHVHHLLPFSHGGPTSERNGALLCGRHHRYVHANGWVGQIIDGHVVWRPPNPDDPDQQFSNARVQAFERQLRALALRWLARNPQVRAPDDTS